MGTHRFKIDGQDFEVEVGTRTGNRVDVTVNGKSYRVEVETPGAATDKPSVARPPAAAVSAAPAIPSTATAASRGSGEVAAPISGVVLSIDVQAGDSVEPTTKVVVLEAMKMENEIFAAVSGTVQAVHVEAQQEVREGDLLITIE